MSTNADQQNKALHRSARIGRFLNLGLSLALGERGRSSLEMNRKLILSLTSLAVVVLAVYCLVNRSTTSIKLINEDQNSLLENPRRWFFEVSIPGSIGGNIDLVVTRDVTGVEVEGTSRIQQFASKPEEVYRNSFKDVSSNHANVLIQLMKIENVANDTCKRTYRIAGSLKLDGTVKSFESVGHDIVSGPPDHSVMISADLRQDTTPLMSLNFHEGNQFTRYDFALESSSESEN